MVKYVYVKHVNSIDICNEKYLRLFFKNVLQLK